MATTSVSKLIHAPRAAVYRACLDPDALVVWRVPDDMRAHMHDFDAREGGAFRMSLTYRDARRGKTAGSTDTFHGTFAELVPDELIVELIAFESDDPQLAGEMRMTTSLRDAPDGTDVTIVHENLPPGVAPEDNVAGTEQSLAKLAELAERRAAESA